MNDLELAVALAFEDSRRRSDPLSYFDWASDAQRLTAWHVGQGIETSHCAANFSGKTHGGAGLAVGMLQDRRGLAGVRLPTFGRPVTGAVLVPNYQQQLDSSQKALRTLIGDWPHEEVFINRGRDLLGAIWVKNQGNPSDDSHDWSRISFISQSDSDPSSVKGQRWDFAWADEPAKEQFWRESRKNARYRWLTWTPLGRSEYEWIDDDFKDCFNQVHEGRIELNSSLYDNRFLSQQKINELVQGYRGDMFAEARIFGRKLDVEHLTPWGNEGYTALQRILPLCQPGKRLKLTVCRNAAAERQAEVECWFKPEPGEEYILVADLGKGTRRSQPIHGRDPLGFLLASWRDPRLVMRYNGFVDGYELALMAAHVGEAYNMALIDFDTTGGYGEPFALGLEQYRSERCKYGYEKVSREQYWVRPGEQDERLGFAISATSRPTLLSEIRGWLDDPSSLRLWSREVVSCLLQVRADKLTGKIEAQGKFHDEDMICLGRLLHLMRTRELPPMRNVQVDMVREAFRKSFGRDDVLPKQYVQGRRKQASWPDKWRD